MTDITLPSLFGIARMTPIQVDADELNIGAGGLKQQYTVPQGKVARIDWIFARRVSGTAPTHYRGEVRISGSSGNRRDLYVVANPAGGDSAHLHLGAWIGETDQIWLGTLGGAADTDVNQSIFLVEYDLFEDA